MTEATPEPYEVKTEEDYAAKFTDGGQAIPVSGGLSIEGICPRCKSEMAFPHVTSVFKFLSPSRTLKGTAKDGENVSIVCWCEEAHPNQPAGVKGCGAYWNVTFQTQP